MRTTTPWWYPVVFGIITGAILVLLFDFVVAMVLVVIVGLAYAIIDWIRRHPEDNPYA